MAKFYKQERGLINLPPGFDKWHVSWTLDNVLEGFKEFYKQNERWPVHTDFTSCTYLPSVKTIERSFGGIRKVREQLGITNTDLRTGNDRTEVMKRIWKRGLSAEEDLYKYLIKVFHEPYVHSQSRFIIGEQTLRVDFLIFHKLGRFAIDIFYPENNPNNYSSNISAKYRIYQNFPIPIYLCIANPAITMNEITKNITSSDIASKRFGGKERNKKATLVDLPGLYSSLGEYAPLPDPYSKG